MAVNVTHAEYDAALPGCQRARDILTGEDRIKAGGAKYLPRLVSQSDAEFEAYKRRALFFNATARTHEAHVGMVYRRAASERRPVNAGALWWSGEPFTLCPRTVGPPGVGLRVPFGRRGSREGKLASLRDADGLGAGTRWFRSFLAQPPANGWEPSGFSAGAPGRGWESAGFRVSTGVKHPGGMPAISQGWCEERAPPPGIGVEWRRPRQGSQPGQSRYFGSYSMPALLSITTNSSRNVFAR